MDAEAAERAIHATLEVLGERLTADEAHALAARLPSDLEHLLDEAAYEGDFDATELYRRVWEREKREETSLGMAKEHADIVLRAVGTALDEDLCARLVRALPEPVGALLLAPVRGAPPPHPHAPSKHAPAVASLAHGRPGSRHPLSEAAPRSGHAQSVARSDDPHADTKLSSSHGLTQEELGETLATGQPPGPTRPISETSDD